ncbi:two-component regulator propeller domain-containing protein [Spirosoma harenae]
MMKARIFTLLTSATFFCFSLAGYAQKDLSSFRFEHLTVNDGLSHSDAMAVAQDQEGFIWIATNKGVNRYDGYEIKHYILPIDNENGLSNNRVRSLHVTVQGIIWAGTEGGGLNVYNPNRDQFVRVNGSQLNANGRSLLHALARTEITAIVSSRQGLIWVSTRQQGLFVLQSSREGVIQSIKQVKLAIPSGTTPDIRDLIIDPFENVWIATYSEGLFVIPASQPEAVAKLANTFDKAPILALAIDQEAGLWVGTNRQVAWISDSKLRARQAHDPYILPQTFRSIGCLHRDSFGHLWIGTDFGLSMVPVQLSAGGSPAISGEMTTYWPLDADPFSINSGRVHCILEDRFQVLWLAASAGGLNKIDLRQKPFGHLCRQLSQQPTLSNNYINSVYKEEAKGILWIATRNGISSYDLARKKYQNYFSRELPGNVTGMDVASIFQDSDGTIWFGSRYDGLISLRRQNGQNVFKTYPEHDGLFRNLECILEDKFGTLWLSSFSNGLTRMSRDGRVLATYTTDNSRLPTDQFTFLLYDKDSDVLWASTRDAGVLKLRISADRLEILNQFKHDPHNTASLRVNYAWPLTKDRWGTLWVGTIGGGLHQIKRTKDGREIIQRCSWLPDSDVESILQDDKGNLWLGSEGLVRVQPKTHHVLRYNIVDGLQSNSFKIGAACRSSDGTLYFGGINGITYLQPRLIQANPYPPFVRITGLSISNQPIGVGQLVNGRVLIQEPLNKPQSLRIKATENDFSISFVGLNFANPKKHRYMYQLVGYNDNWVQLAPGQRMANFANLPAGNYTFQVKAENGEGQWTHHPATLRLSILPPWWKTWWAYALYTVLFGGALLLARRILLQQQALKNKIAFEHFQYEKEKELSELKLEFFTNVSHELRTPLTLILGPMEELAASAWKFSSMKDKVLLVHQQTRRLLSLINQLLDFRKMESQHIPLHAVKSDAGSFLTELFLMFKLKAEEQHIHYTIHTLPEPIMLYFDRSKLEVAIINVLSNALKYTPADRGVQLRVSVVGDPGQPACFQQHKLVNNFLEITVRDEGVGIRPDDLSRVFDVYYQATRTETMRVVGTGIGLSLVKQFIERHGGEVAIASQVDQGTTFTIRMPFGKEHLPASDLAEEASIATLLKESEVYIDTLAELSPVTALVPTTLRLLVVEDNSEVRHYINHLFAAKFEVYTAVDGIDGWEKAMEILPDVIISDIMMPRSDGLELCKKIKQHPKTLHIPVVLLTARVAVVHEIEGLETGADEYISKPFNPDLLIAKVNTLVYNRLKLRQYYQQKILLEPTQVLIPDADKAFLETAMTIVETNMTEPEFSVQELVKEMAMSRSVFYRRIKSITGHSAVEFINDVRMKRAAQLLTTSQLRVSEVCALVGLEDVKYFRKAFQQVHGLSPSDYARKHRLEREMQEVEVG